MTNRREFLKGSAWMGVAAAASGCRMLGFGMGGSMAGFSLPPMRRVRVGVVGLGSRGSWAMRRLTAVPGVDVVAICDKVDVRLRECVSWLAEKKYPKPRVFGGEEGWKSLCEVDGIDVVYIVTPWALHVPIALRGLRNGKIALVEVPGAMTVDECWELVETSEKVRLPCMQLENCVYGEIELLEFHIARLGLLGELVHAEGGYIHDLRSVCKSTKPGETGHSNEWRYEENLRHKGNRYPTHGLVPLCLAMDVNRGDRLDYLVSLESNQANFACYRDAVLEPDDPRRYDPLPQMGDVNLTLIKTVRGRSILVQHDVSTPRPYSRIQLITGTKGAVGDYPFRVAIEEGVGTGAHRWFDEEKTKVFREKYRHPLYRTVGSLAKKVGGHGGMDFIMDLRWAYCLQNGLPLDMDVYDLATSSCLCELTELSVRNRSRSYDIPDFTHGGWRTAKPWEVVDIDTSRIDFGSVGVGDNSMEI